MVAKLNIVVVEDNNDLRELTCQVLTQEGHRVTGLACAEELEDLAGGEPADMFLLDLNLPGEDGISLSQRIRKAQPLVGIFIISARSDLDDKLIGYESGADLYITKPVIFAELSAALRSFARRRHSSKQDKTDVTRGLVLDKMDLSGPLGETKLTATEAMLLTAFARAPSGTLETWQIAEMLGVEANETMKNSIAVRITRLRKKLMDLGAEGLVIESIRNVGYQLLAYVEIE
jgi:DNA-binding response OmpR family regulator